MKRLPLALFAATLAACAGRDRVAPSDTTGLRPVSAVPERSAYLSVSDLSPEAGGIVVVAGTLDVGGTLTLGSYRVRLGYDSTKLHFVEEAANDGMMRVVNPVAGDVIVVGAASGPAASGTLFVIRFRVDDPAGINSLVLRIDELNDAAFADQKATITRASKLVVDRSLAGRAIPTGAAGARQPVNTEALRAPGALAIDSISPRSAKLEAERVTDLTLYGRGFAPRGNVVMFGDREIPGLMSERGGTMIRFPAPVIRAHEGRIPVHVLRDGTPSNAVFFVVRENRR